MTRTRSLLVALAMAVALIAGAFPDSTGGVHHYAAFTALNVAMLGVAFWVALPAIGGAACLLLFAGPTMWWMDKATLDVFAFSLMTVAFVEFGLAGAVALIVAIVLPAYGQPLHWPALAELIAVPLDPAIGVMTNFPALVLALGVAIGLEIRRKPMSLSADQRAAVVAGAALLFSVAQATSLHGDTPGLSRYANWFIPLTVPFLRVAHARGGTGWRRGMWSLAAASAILCAVLFNPATPVYAREPTPAANYFWTQHPSWNNPLPEVFSELIHTGEDRAIPAATPNCEKLLVGGSATGPVLPIPCFPAAVPPECAAEGALCYANRTGAQYRFVGAPGGEIRRQGFTVLPRFAWPAASVPRVRDLLTEWQWWTLQPGSGAGSMLREIHDVRVTELEGERRLVFILRQAKPGARIALRPRWRATGVLMDPTTGQTLRTLEFNDEPLTRWELDVPSGPELLLLFLRAS